MLGVHGMAPARACSSGTAGRRGCMFAMLMGIWSHVERLENNRHRHCAANAQCGVEILFVASTFSPNMLLQAGQRASSLLGGPSMAHDPVLAVSGQVARKPLIKNCGVSN